MRDKISKFLFPLESNNGELKIRFRFGIFSVLLWKLFTLIFWRK